MTATELLYPVLGAVANFIIPFAVVLLGFSLLHMIGKTN